MERTIREAEKQEFALINCFEITPRDLFCLISEIHSEEMAEHRREIRSRFKVEGKSANIFDFFALKREFVAKWYAGEYGVTYRGIPIRLYESKREHL